LERLGINGGFLLAQIINFLVLFGLLAFAAWNPLISVLESRSKKIAKGLEDARAAEQARANAERDAQKYIEQRRAEANKLIEEGRSRGDEQARQVLAQAQTEAEEIRTRARQEAEEERNTALGEVRSQVAQIAIAAAERVIGQSLDVQKAQNAIADFFSKLPADVQNLGQEVEVVTALPLNDSEKKKIQQQTGAQNVNFRVDPAILGGVILRAGDRVIDGSARSGLNGLAQQMR